MRFLHFALWSWRITRMVVGCVCGCVCVGAGAVCDYKHRGTLYDVSQFQDEKYVIELAFIVAK